MRIVVSPSAFRKMINSMRLEFCILDDINAERAVECWNKISQNCGACP